MAFLARHFPVEARPSEQCREDVGRQQTQVGQVEEVLGGQIENEGLWARQMRRVVAEAAGCRIRMW
jgi:hypothetical protein